MEKDREMSGEGLEGKCLNKSGSSDPFNIEVDYGGIPQALLMDFIIWLVLMAVFLVMRKNAFSVMTSGLNRNLGKMTEALFRRQSEEEAAASQNLDAETGEDVTDDRRDETSQMRASGEELAWLTRTESHYSFLSWMKGTWKCLLYSDDTMLSLAGPDAVQYLRFQRFLIALLSLVMVLSICIILPINYQGVLFGKKSEFGHTTITNLDVG